eukprot:CAMPEP_0176379082 /NCGR_PEP_ID=MMETSP0126-20121128/30107_1 /TAXON_ID=141414 ORGANISM="Strombidinopsis acuminatum, Strain SPMC142" /NCGR_SAMPLE_ID=MMETSP0126 /ASSEMBLY_ACC=CAM_ASM_000229 /LENGTH=32 /DNA_ID= /DNA_START= /DNA_END= /DNA_ORIENTATION=
MGRESSVLLRQDATDLMADDDILAILDIEEDD